MTEPADRGPGRPARKRRPLVILACVLLGPLLVVEALLRWIDVPGFSRAELAPAYVASEAALRTVPHPYLAYAMKPGWTSPPESEKSISHNSFGLRGPETTLEKPPGTLRVVCLGGSSTYGNTPTSNEATWPARLEHYLNQARPDRHVEVLNGGAPGWSTFESSINLTLRMLDFEPDLVIVYHAINDARCALYGEPVRDNTHWRDVWPVYRPSPLEPLFERSMSYLIWRRYFTDYLAKRADVGYYAIVGYSPDMEDPYVKEEVPPRGVENFRRNMITIQAAARARGARVLFATQGIDAPDLYEAPSQRSQFAALGILRQLTRDLAAELDVALCDAGPVLEEEADRQRAASEDGIQQDVFTWEVHLTDAGADLLARTFAELIEAEGLLP